MKTEELEAQLPWPQPKSVYDSDGPKCDAHMRPFEIEGVLVKVTATGKFGEDTLRDRYKVECLDCGEVIHSATTSATIRVLQHLEEKHGVRAD